MSRYEINDHTKIVDTAGGHKYTICDCGNIAAALYVRDLLNAAAQHPEEEDVNLCISCERLNCLGRGPLPIKQCGAYTAKESLCNTCAVLECGRRGDVFKDCAIYLDRTPARVPPLKILCNDCQNTNTCTAFREHGLEKVMCRRYEPPAEKSLCDDCSPAFCPGRPLSGAAACDYHIPKAASTPENVEALEQKFAEAEGRIQKLRENMKARLFEIEEMAATWAREDVERIQALRRRERGEKKPTEARRSAAGDCSNSSCGHWKRNTVRNCMKLEKFPCLCWYSNNDPLHKPKRRRFKTVAFGLGTTPVRRKFTSLENVSGYISDMFSNEARQPFSIEIAPEKEGSQ